MRYTGRIAALSLAVLFSLIEIIILNRIYGEVPISDSWDILVYGPLSWWIGGLYDRYMKQVKDLHRAEIENRRLIENKNTMMEKLIEESQHRYHLLFHNIADAIFIFDLEGNLIDGNPAVERMSGYSLDELRVIGCYSIMDPDDADNEKIYTKKAANGQEHEFESVIHHKDGVTIDVHVKVHPLIIDGETIGLFKIIRDITDTRRMSERIRESEKLHVAGQLAAGVAHEIRNPLTTIRGFMQLFRDKVDSYYTELILTELDRINFIISEFLVLSKPQAISYKLTDVRTIASQVISFMEAEMNMKNVQVTTSFEPDLPLVRSEENQLKQVFVNLLKNASESMEEGGTIHLQLHADENVLFVHLRDEGIGMPDHVVKRLGEPFYTTKEGGTGLGLMVSKKIIAHHGGQITIDSELGKGTRVTIMLPIKSEPADDNSSNG